MSLINLAGNMDSSHIEGMQLRDKTWKGYIEFN